MWPVCPQCLLHVCSCAGAEQSGACQKRSLGAESGHAPRHRALSSPANGLDLCILHWKPTWNSDRISLHSVIAAGNRHSCSDRAVAALVGHTRYLTRTHVAAGLVSPATLPVPRVGPAPNPLPHGVTPPTTSRHEIGHSHPRVPGMAMCQRPGVRRRHGRCGAATAAATATAAARNGSRSTARRRVEVVGGKS
jgi:hypothetical protein